MASRACGPQGGERTGPGSAGVPGDRGVPAAETWMKGGGLAEGDAGPRWGRAAGLIRGKQAATHLHPDPQEAPGISSSLPWNQARVSQALCGAVGVGAAVGAPSLSEVMASGQPLLTGISLNGKDGDAATLDGTVSELSGPPRSSRGARQRAGRGSHTAPLFPTLGSWTSRAPLRVRGPPSTEGASQLLPQHDSPQRRACLGLWKARALPTAPLIHTLHVHAGPVVGAGEGMGKGEAGLCRVGDRSGWAGRELGLMHVCLNWCSAWK